MESLKRRKVKQALAVFRNTFEKLVAEKKEQGKVNLQAKNSTLIEAAMLMQKSRQWVNTERRVGSVDGIEIGDRFQYRAELNVIGLHRHFANGIDYMDLNGIPTATSIVVTDRCDNTKTSSDSLVYIGEGGGNQSGNKSKPRDQKLEGRNLALKNSMETKRHVRVILKDNSGKSDDVGLYVYDGLYIVVKMNQGRGESGKLVFKFTLKRVQGQRANLKSVFMKNNNSGKWLKPKVSVGVARKQVLRVKDVSNGLEKFPIRVMTSVDCIETPPSFKYIIKPIYSEKFEKSKLFGCDCKDECIDPAKCACIRKNGGEVRYDCNKKLLLASPTKSSVIYECGPACKCFSSCINRVSQCGIQFQLEIIRTESTGWGLKTRSYVPSGSFVCEYAGEFHQETEAGSRGNVEDYIFDMGVGKGYIDATNHGNVGRFINHSCLPNLEVKDVMYDHNYMSFPHKMLFAVKDIAAGRELSYDYNCSRKGRFVEGASNTCFCGSTECVRQIYIE